MASPAWTPGWGEGAGTPCVRISDAPVTALTVRLHPPLQQASWGGGDGDLPGACPQLRLDPRQTKVGKLSLFAWSGIEPASPAVASEPLGNRMPFFEKPH